MMLASRTAHRPPPTSISVTLVTQIPLNSPSSLSRRWQRNSNNWMCWTCEEPIWS